MQLGRLSAPEQIENGERLLRLPEFQQDFGFKNLCANFRSRVLNGGKRLVDGLKSMSILLAPKQILSSFERRLRPVWRAASEYQ